MDDAAIRLPFAISADPVLDRHDADDAAIRPVDSEKRVYIFQSVVVAITDGTRGDAIGRETGNKMVEESRLNVNVNVCNWEAKTCSFSAEVTCAAAASAAAHFNTE